MLKIPSLSKVFLCLLCWLSTGPSVRVNGQDWNDGSSNGFGRGEQSGGDWRERGFRGRGGFRGGFRDSDRDGGGGFRGGWGDDGEEYSGRGWGGRGESRNSGDDRMSGNESNSGAVEKPRSRVTVDLPATFMEGDHDRDGQIGLYEWRQWKRGNLAGFLALDHNGDGYLTPAELVKGPRSSQNSLSGTMSPGTADGAFTPGRTSAENAPATSPSVTEDSAEVNRASNMFRLLDSNRSGQLEPEEWARGKTIRVPFEAAKIDLTVAMSKDDFLKHFVELNKKK